MPKGHALYMDVKFPMASYLRYLEVDTNAEREVHLKRFLADVRLRVKELAKRDYAGESDQRRPPPPGSGRIRSGAHRQGRDGGVMVSGRRGAREPQLGGARAGRIV